MKNWKVSLEVRNVNMNKVPYEKRYVYANVCADGGYLCFHCATSERARLFDVDPSCPDDDQWRVIGVRPIETHERCDHCSHLIRTPVTA